MTFENMQQAEAEKEGMVLRYVGSVDVANKKCEVKLAKYPKTHPFAGTQYADNIVAYILHRTTTLSPLYYIVLYILYIRIILYLFLPQVCRQHYRLFHRALRAAAAGDPGPGRRRSRDRRGYLRRLPPNCRPVPRVD